MRVVLTAQMIVQEAECSTYPASDTVTFKWNAARFRLFRDNSAGAPRWIFKETGNYRTEPFSDRFDPTEFALVNRKHGDALRMHSRGVGSLSSPIGTSGSYRASFSWVLEPLSNDIRVVPFTPVR